MAAHWLILSVPLAGRRSKAASRRKASATEPAPGTNNSTAADSVPAVAPPASAEAGSAAAGPEPVERQDAVARLSAFAGLIARFTSQTLPASDQGVSTCQISRQDSMCMCCAVSLLTGMLLCIPNLSCCLPMAGRCSIAYNLLTTDVLHRRSRQLSPVRRGQACVWVPDGVASESCWRGSRHAACLTARRRSHRQL